MKRYHHFCQNLNWTKLSGMRNDLWGTWAWLNASSALELIIPTGGKMKLRHCLSITDGENQRQNRKLVDGRVNSVQMHWRRFIRAGTAVWLRNWSCGLFLHNTRYYIIMHGASQQCRLHRGHRFYSRDMSSFPTNRLKKKTRVGSILISGVMDKGQLKIWIEVLCSRVWYETWNISNNELILLFTPLTSGSKFKQKYDNFFMGHFGINSSLNARQLF